MKHKLPLRLAHIYIGLARGIYFYFHRFPVVYIYIQKFIFKRPANSSTGLKPGLRF